MAIRVFHIISHFDVGGAEMVATNIAKSKNKDFEYYIIEVIRARSEFSSVFVRELQKNKIHYYRSYIPEYHFHYVVEKLAALLFPLWFIFLYLRYKPQIIHSHTEIPDMAVWNFFTLFPFLLKQCKIVRTIHNTNLWTGLKKTGIRIEKWMQKNDANVAISVSVQNNYNEEYGEKARMIYNGIAANTEYVRYPELREDKINVLFAGRFEEQKGIYTLVEIIKKLKDDNRYFFHVVGSGRLKEIIKCQLDGCGNVEIHNPVYGLSKYLSSFDYLLMPSLHEGLALLPIEASLAGLPTIINDCKGLSETLPDKWPLKVQNNSVDEYMNIFNNVLPSLDRPTLAQTAATFGTTHFSLMTMQTEYEKLYHEKMNIQ